MSSSNTFRAVDAAANRCTEGWRVAEDYARFILDDQHLTTLCKQARHRLVELVDTWAADRCTMRDTPGDIGTSVSTATEFQRENVEDVVVAAMHRVQQSLRSLEEFSKTLSPEVARQIESLRYDSYTIHAALARTSKSRHRLEQVKLCVLIDARESESELANLAEQLLIAGVDMLQLRDKQFDDRILLARAALLRKITHAHDKLLIINDRPDLAKLSGADGVHLGQDDLPVGKARQIVGPTALVGLSTHRIEQAGEAVLLGADYLGVGPTFPSQTKQFDKFPGLDFIVQVAEQIKLPAFTIGGINAGNVSRVVEAGASRVAVSGSVINAADPPGEVKRLLEVL